MDEVRRSLWHRRARRRDLPVECWNGPPGLRPRVLLECPPHYSPALVAEVLESEGFEVALCEGPAADASCALTRAERCPLVDGADVVVNLLGISEQRYVDLVRDVSRQRDGLPIVIEVPQPKAREEVDALRGCHVAHPPLERHQLVDHIWSALDLDPRAPG